MEEHKAKDVLKSLSQMSIKEELNFEQIIFSYHPVEQTE